MCSGTVRQKVYVLDLTVLEMGGFWSVPYTFYYSLVKFLFVFVIVVTVLTVVVQVFSLRMYGEIIGYISMTI